MLLLEEEQKSLSGCASCIALYSNEIADYCTRVILDGRFLAEFATDPIRVSNELGMTLSTNAVEAILSNTEVLAQAIKSALEQSKCKIANAQNALIVAVVIITASGIQATERVVDESGACKL